MHVTPGRIVMYQTDGRGGLEYALPAMVVVTEENYDPRTMERDPASPEYLPPPEGVTEEAIGVHLRVFSPGTDYVELNVPHDSGKSPRSWHWPSRV